MLPLLLFVSVLLSSLAQISLKHGMIAVTPTSMDADGLPALFLRAIVQPYIIAGVIFFGISFIVWLLVLSKANVSYAYPFQSMGYIMIAVFSHFVLGEQLSGVKLLGIAVICAGVAILAFGTEQ